MIKLPLLTEVNTIAYDHRTITEAQNPNVDLILRDVVLQRANSKNQNGRVYPRSILFREAKRYLDEFVSQQNAVGELDHPESPVVNLKNVSHSIIRLEIVGDDVRGDIKILTTPSGNIVRELIKNNIKIGVSSRGMGSVTNTDENTVEVQEDYSLICFDIVSNPSTFGAFINESVSPNPLSNLNELIRDFLSEVNG